MKLWNVKSSECVKSLEVSEDNATVWALAVSRNEDYVITGASDSTLILWKVTFPACPTAQFTRFICIHCYSVMLCIFLCLLRPTVSWWRGTVVERRSLTGELSLSLSCARPAADG